MSCRRCNTGDDDEGLMVDSNGCFRCYEVPKVKGRFGLAWVSESPECPNPEPVGWQVEFCDTPSKVEEKCQEMVRWINCPPLPRCEPCPPDELCSPHNPPRCNPCAPKTNPCIPKCNRGDSATRKCRCCGGSQHKRSRCYPPQAGYCRQRSPGHRRTCTCRAQSPKHCTCHDLPVKDTNNLIGSSSGDYENNPNYQQYYMSNYSPQQVIPTDENKYRCTKQTLTLYQNQNNPYNTDTEYSYNERSQKTKNKNNQKKRKHPECYRRNDAGCQCVVCTEQEVYTVSLTQEDNKSGQKVSSDSCPCNCICKGYPDKSHNQHPKSTHESTHQSKQYDTNNQHQQSFSNSQMYGSNTTNQPYEEKAFMSSNKPDGKSGNVHSMETIHSPNSPRTSHGRSYGYRSPSNNLTAKSSKSNYYTPGQGPNQSNADHGYSSVKTHGHGHSQTDGHGHTQTDGHGHTQTDGHGHTQTDGHGHTQTDGHGHAQADGHGHAQADGHGHAQADDHGHGQLDGNGHAHSQPDGNAHAHGHGQPDGNVHVHGQPDGNGHAHGQPDGNGHAHGQPDGNAHAHGHAQPDGNAHAHGHAQPDSNGHAQTDDHRHTQADDHGHHAQETLGQEETHGQKGKPQDAAHGHLPIHSNKQDHGHPSQGDIRDHDHSPKDQQKEALHPDEDQKKQMQQNLTHKPGEKSSFDSVEAALQQLHERMDGDKLTEELEKLQEERRLANQYKVKTTYSKQSWLYPLLCHCCFKTKSDSNTKKKDPRVKTPPTPAAQQQTLHNNKTAQQETPQNNKNYMVTIVENKELEETEAALADGTTEEIKDKV